MLKKLRDIINKLSFLKKLYPHLDNESFKNDINQMLDNKQVFFVSDEKKVEAIRKLLEAKDFYVVTNPDKVEPAWMLENSFNQFFVFEYYDDENKCWAYNWWTNFPVKLARDAAEHCFKWKEGQEDIEWQLKQIFYDSNSNDNPLTK